MDHKQKVKNVIILLHGVNTRESKNNLLKVRESFEKDPMFDETWEVVFIHYGYVFFLTTILPYIKYSKIQKVQNRLWEIQNEFPNAELHIIAHSFGTDVSYQAIKRSDYDNNNPPLKIGNFIPIAGIINQYEKFDDTIGEGQIRNVFNFCSYKDWVIKYQPLFGKCGYLGFCTSPSDKKHKYMPHEDLPVFNFRFNLKHSEYFSDRLPDFFELWASIIRKHRKR